jgi:hypothetical protein
MDILYIGMLVSYGIRNVNCLANIHHYIVRDIMNTFPLVRALNVEHIKPYKSANIWQLTLINLSRPAEPSQSGSSECQSMENTGPICATNGSLIQLSGLRMSHSCISTI